MRIHPFVFFLSSYLLRQVNGDTVDYVDEDYGNEVGMDYSIQSYHSHHSAEQSSDDIAKPAFTSRFLETRKGSANLVPANPDDSIFPSLPSTLFRKGEEPCYRECSRDKRTARRCEFNFKLEYYITNSSECMNCSASNLAGCSQSGCIVADGVRRSINIVNGMMPGPPIRVCEGDTVVVRVENNLDEPTTIHWHGIHQKGTPFYDGVPQITQCPILPRTSLKYEFETPLAGTYFWHSHSGFQRADGLYGSLIVRKDPRSELYGPKGKNKLYDFDRPQDELLIMDWQERFTRDVYLDSKHANDDFRPRNILINGKGVRRGHFANDAVDGPPTPLHTPIQEVVIERNKGYRLRLISNGIMSCPIQISIDHHTMTVIASDGFDVRPVQVNTIVIYPGERWDVVVRGDQTPGIYWIKFHGVNVCAGVDGPNTFQLALLKYEGLNTQNNLPNHPVRSWEQASPRRRARVLNAFVCRSIECQQVADLQSVEDDDPEILRANPDYKFYLALDFNPIDAFSRISVHKLGHVAIIKGMTYTPQINHITFVPPKISLLTQPQDHHLMYNCSHGPDGKFFTSRKLGLEPMEMEGDERGEEKNNEETNCYDQLCACVHMLKVKLNSIVEVIMIDEGRTLDTSHPFHLHGHSFRLIGMGQIDRNGTTTQHIKQLDSEGQLDRLLVNAPIKDTVNVPDGGYTIFRFRANNPGFWFYHCHVEFHVEGGMGLVFQVGEVDEMPPSPSSFSKCGQEKVLPLPPAQKKFPPFEIHKPKPTPKPSSKLTTTFPVSPFRTLLEHMNNLEETPSIYYNTQDGSYYWPFIRPTETNSIYIRTTRNVHEWPTGRDKKVFTFKLPFESAPSIGQPKLHKVNREFYLYFHVASSAWPTTRLFAVKSNGGPDSSADAHYERPIRLVPLNGNGNHGRPESPTVLEMDDGQLFLIWSDKALGWGFGEKYQVLVIARMKSPTEIQGKTLVLRDHNPTFSFSLFSRHSRNGINVNRSPQVFREGAKIFVIFSIFNKESNSFCTGMMEILGNVNPLIQGNWKKYEPNCSTDKNGLDRVYIIISSPWISSSSAGRQELWKPNSRWDLFSDPFRGGQFPFQSPVQMFNIHRPFLY